MQTHEKSRLSRNMIAVKISIEKRKFQDYSLQVNFSQLQEDTLLRRYNTLNDICMNNQSNNNYADFNAKINYAEFLL